MTRDIRIAAVSYLNTVPFLYGIEHGHSLCPDLLLSPPSQCAAAFRERKADIALIPAAAVSSFPEANVITDYCIGADKPVRTVVLMSDSPLSGIRRIWLDSHSLTSVRLVQVLAAELWKIEPEWYALTDYSRMENPQPGDGFLLIGDKVFSQEGRFAYIWDLAAAWRELTGLPFVFAVWLARPEIPRQVVTALGEALRYGVSHIPEAIATYGHSDKPYALDYLTRNIDFLFDAQKHRALELFWEKGMKHAARINPG